jgi:hypothetical protein
MFQAMTDKRQAPSSIKDPNKRPGTDEYRKNNPDMPAWLGGGKGHTPQPQNEQRFQTFGMPQQNMSATGQQSPVKAPSIPKFQEGNKTDLSDFKNAIGQKPDEQFSLGDLKGMMDQQQQAGGESQQLDPARFQNPEQVSQLINQMNQVLSPLAQQQKDTLQSGFNQNMQNMDNKWASRGLASSGGAMKQQQQGVNALAGQMKDVDAQTQANAIPLALQFGQMGLQEDGQRFNQNMANRQFDQSRSQAGVGNLMNALGIQQGQQQDFLNQLGKVTGMEMQDNQWAQQFGLQKQGQEFGMGMDVANFNQSQYTDDRNFNEDTRRYDQGFTEDQFRDRRNFGEDQFRDRRNFGEDTRRFDIGTSLDLSRMFGQGVDPFGGGGTQQNTGQGSNSSLPSIFQQFAGKDTMENQKFKTGNEQWEKSFDADQDWRSKQNSLNWAQQNLNQKKFDYEKEMDKAKSSQLSPEQKTYVMNDYVSGAFTEGGGSAEGAIEWLTNGEVKNEETGEMIPVWKDLSDHGLDIREVIKSVSDQYGTPYQLSKDEMTPEQKMLMEIIGNMQQ